MQASPVMGRVADASPMSVPPTNGRRSTMALSVGALLVVGVGIALAMRPSEETPTATSVEVEEAEVAELSGGAEAARASEGPGKVLDEARELAAGGNIVMAHRKLSEIPQDSTLRQTEAFRDIEQRWADEIFKTADESPDPEERRSLLDKVAKTPEVDAERRLRAASELAKLGDDLEAMDVADLPSADNRSGRPRASKPGTVVMNAKSRVIHGTAPRRARVQPSSPAVAKTQKVGVRPTVTAPPADEEDEGSQTKEAAEPPPPPAPKPKPQEPAKPDSELIRDSPF